MGLRRLVSYLLVTVLAAGGATMASSPPAMAVGATLGGLVTDGSDAPLEGVDVSVYLDHGGSDLEFVDTTTTDGTGHWTLDGLAAGTYRVGFDDFLNGHASEYWNDKPDLFSADQIVLSANGSNTAINAKLSMPGRIQGTVTNASSSAVQNAQVTLYSLFEGSWSFTDSASTAPDGSYELPSVNPGTYRLGFSD